MKVKDINKHFKDYKPDEEVFIMWWDKEDFDGFGAGRSPHDVNDNRNMSDEEWTKVLKALNNYAFDSTTWELVRAIEDELETIREDEWANKAQEYKEIFREKKNE